MSRRNRNVNCSFAFLVPKRSIGPGVQESLDYSGLPFLGGDHKRVVSEVVPYVSSYASFQQPANDLIHAGFCGERH